MKPSGIKKGTILAMALSAILLLMSCSHKEVESVTVILEAEFSDSLMMAAGIDIRYVVLDKTAATLQTAHVTDNSWRYSAEGTEGILQISFTPADSLKAKTYDMSFLAGILFHVVYQDGTDELLSGDKVVADAAGIRASEVPDLLSKYNRQTCLATYIRQTGKGKWVVQHNSNIDF